MKTVTSKDGTQIAYDIVGNGPAIVLVDGAMCSRAFGPMTPLADVLAKHFTVYTYDRRGRGDSGDTEPYAVEREVEDIDALIQVAGGSVYIYGISSGAVLAARAAAALGPKVKKLALYEAPFVLDDSRPPLPTDYVERYKKFLSEGNRGAMVELFNTEVVGLPPEFLDPIKNSPAWPLMEAVAPTLIYDAAVMGDSQNSKPLSAEMLGMLGSIEASTLVMDGGASPAFLHNAAEALGSAISGAERQTLEGQTHQVDQDVLAPVLIEFFKR